MKNEYLILLFLIFYTTSSFAQVQIGADIDGEAAQDEAGYAVAMSADGNRVAVGAPRNNGASTDAGHVRIYDLVDDAWQQVGADIDGEAAQDASGNAVSLSADGNRVAIGANFNDGNGTKAGHVRIYEWMAGAWQQIGADIDGEAVNNECGSALQLSADGSRIIIGSPKFSSLGSLVGQVRVFDFDGSTWQQVGVTIIGEDIDNEFGTAVSISANGNRIAIGAPKNDGNGVYAGHVRVYDFIGGAWQQIGSDIDGEAGNDRLGAALSLSADGSRIAIGANKNDGTGIDAGHVRIFELVDNNWEQVGADIDGEAAGDELGTSVALSTNGDRVVIGANRNDGNGTSAGHVRIYDFYNGEWQQEGEDIDGEAQFDNSGISVALSNNGRQIAIGANLNDGNGTIAGHVRVYELPCAITEGRDVINSCEAYTWIDGNTYSSTNNTATFLLTNEADCDSIVYLDLTVTIIDNSISLNLFSLIANSNTASYQWVDCDNNFIPLEGETNQNFTATTSGNYAVILTENNCEEISECITVNIVSIQEQHFGENVNLFPNPNTGHFQLNLGAVYPEVEITITTILGQTIRSQKYKNSEQLDLNIETEAGLYFVELKLNDGSTIILKVIKN